MGQGRRCSFPFDMYPTDGLIPQLDIGSAFPFGQAEAEVFGSCSLQKTMERDYM